ncbi:MAG: hypothetical protein LBR11_11885, partial [Deltaproteobacteria bacterium]|nr:hypothetical protein [Deltaproteobacteria bacterium]
KLFEDSIDQTVKEEYIKMAFLPVAEAKFEWLKRVVREEGIEEGRRSTALETAKKMLADNLPISSVVRYTGLTEEEVGSPPNDVSADLSSG